MLWVNYKQRRKRKAKERFVLQQPLKRAHQSKHCNTNSGNGEMFKVGFNQPHTVRSWRSWRLELVRE